MASKKYPREVPHRAKPLQEWQVDYTGPLPTDRGHCYMFTSVDTATGLEFAWLVATTDQLHTVTALEHLADTYGQPLLITSDRGTPFTGQEMQAWASTNDVRW